MIEPTRLNERRSRNQKKNLNAASRTQITYMLIRTMPSDHTSAARGLYTGATLFLHSVKEIRVRKSKEEYLKR
jgi:hypothetical protein